MEKDAYQPSETLRAKLTIDNSKCYTKVHEIKIRLLREISCHNSHWKPVYKIEEQLDEVKLPGDVQAGESKEKKLKLDLSSIPPTNCYLDDYLKHGSNIPEEI